MTDGVLKVLYESDSFPGPDHLGVTTTTEYISNQKLVKQYLERNDCIPHFHMTLINFPNDICALC